MPDRPLDGVRIVTVEQYGAGPYGSLFLAQLGAEVIKIENPAIGGDVSRHTGPYFLGEADSYFFQTFNQNKKSLTLNLKAPQGRDILHKLAARSEAVINNLRGDQPAKLGLDYAALKAANPAIVCGHLSAYGRDGERASWPGYDYLMQAEAGFMALTGEPDAPPARFGLSMVDFMTGTMLAFGVTAAIVGARASGVGRDVDVSLMDAAVHQLSYPATWYLNEGHRTQRVARSAHPSIAPSQLYRTADGWLFIMAQTDKFWHKLCEQIDRPDLADDPRFDSQAARRDNRDALTDVLDEILSARATAEWLAVLQGQVPAAAVNDMAQALDNPLLAASGMLAGVPHPEAADMRMLANPIRVDGERVPATRAPALGEHTGEVLDMLGYSEADVASLKDAKVI